MNKIFIRLTALFLGVVVSTAATAEEHAKEALKHSAEAADAKGDSKSIGYHAGKALDHIERAKVENASNPEAVKNLKNAEADLKAAVKNSNRYNTESAAKDAADAKSHLEAVHK